MMKLSTIALFLILGEGVPYFTIKHSNSCKFFIDNVFKWREFSSIPWFPRFVFYHYIYIHTHILFSHYSPSYWSQVIGYSSLCYAAALFCFLILIFLILFLSTMFNFFLFSYLFEIDASTSTSLGYITIQLEYSIESSHCGIGF